MAAFNISGAAGANQGAAYFDSLVEGHAAFLAAYLIPFTLRADLEPELGVIHVVSGEWFAAKAAEIETGVTIAAEFQAIDRGCFLHEPAALRALGVGCPAGFAILLSPGRAIIGSGNLAAAKMAV